MTPAFTFNTRQRIVIENGSAAGLAGHAAAFLSPRLFPVTDTGIVALDLRGPCEADALAIYRAAL